MKTKKRNSINREPNIYKKKIITRNMNNKTTNDSTACLSSASHVSSTNKSSPNTRAKSNCIVKSVSDPYAFSKMDEEDKIPIKRIKVHEKIGKEIGVNTSSLSTMTEPEYLGPCEPGTSIELQGIVWLETATGLLVINVTWRGRTYVGTLMDSTKYEFTPSFSQENLTKFEGRPPNRSARGKKRQVGNPGNHFSLRSNNIRHSSRLNESMNSPNADSVIKKLSSRQTNNLINYFDSTNQSATASASGDSDTDKNSYSKFSTSNKTRSVTRSITKLNKTANGDINSNSAEDSNCNLVKCTKANCFKRFIDMTAYQYHLQRCHDSAERSDNSFDKLEDSSNEYDQVETKNHSIKKEPIVREKETNSNSSEVPNLDKNEPFKSANCKLNGILVKESYHKVDSFDFNSDSENEKNHSLTPFNYNENKGDLKISENDISHQQIIDIKTLIKSENLSPPIQELSINLPKISDIFLNNTEIFQSTISSSTIETCSYNNNINNYTTTTTNSNNNNSCSIGIDSKTINLSIESPLTPNKSLLATSKTVPKIVSGTSSPSAVISHSSTNIRTVSAPTVSIPVELVNSSNNQSSSTISCPTLIRPKPNQNSLTSLIHSSQNRKYKTSKSHSQQNGILEPFQIPSSSPLILKKRPLVPLKVAVNQTSNNTNNSNSNNSINRMYPLSSQNNVTSPSQTNRHIRSSSISPVTPILPATSTINISSSSSATCTTNSVAGSMNSSLGSMFHNGQLSVRRSSVSANLQTNSALSSLISLKPIQPKPKTSQFPAPLTTSYPGINTSTYQSSLPIMTQSMSGLSNIHVSHQRQILPSPISKSDLNITSEENLIHKIESLKTNSLKRKRRKPEKKNRINFHETNRYKKFALNPIQPKHVSNDHFISKSNNNNNNNITEEFGLTNDKYKTDEENSHSPGYSDLSETNDTPAPILEKEIDLKSGECDKLVICNDFDSISIYRHNSSSSDNYDDPKDLSNKPPALMPAVLSSDLVNGSTNDLDYREMKPKISRKKTLTNKKSQKLKEFSKTKIPTNQPNVSEWIEIPSSKSSSLMSVNRKSFQSSLAIKQTLSSEPLISSELSASTISGRDYSNIEHQSNNSKFVNLNRTSITSAINDYVRTSKPNEVTTNVEDKSCSNVNLMGNSLQSLHNSNEEVGKITNKSSASPSNSNNNNNNNNNGKFSVQALTSPQDIVSRSFSFATSSTISSNIPNTKLSNALFKN